MVPHSSPLIELVKLPVPDPSVVRKSDSVGFSAVLQQTPRAVTDAPPSSVISPPLVAELYVISVTDDVVTVDRIAGVAKFTSLP